tara:strand:+ start:1050 stop:1493 length:444 start_codon:yes stop_codon:yes gene_type:complete
MEYKIEKLVITDLRDVEEIGKLSLPIYYKLSDLIYIFFDNLYLYYKIYNNKTDKILGFIIIKKFERRHHIMSIGVLPEYRRKGLGSLLINYIKELDNDKISLYVLTNNKNAISFYNKNKFKEIQRVEDYYTTLPVKSAFYYEFIKNK